MSGVQGRRKRVEEQQEEEGGEKGGREGIVCGSVILCT